MPSPRVRPKMYSPITAFRFARKVGEDASCVVWVLEPRETEEDESWNPLLAISEILAYGLLKIFTDSSFQSIEEISTLGASCQEFI